MAKSDVAITHPKDLESEILQIIDEEIAQGTSFTNDLGQLGVDESRSTAMDYYRGVMRDVPADPDWSHAVSRDVSNTIDATLPGLMRVFAGAGQLLPSRLRIRATSKMRPTPLSISITSGRTSSTDT
jgi:hypothetical protein